MRRYDFPAAPVIIGMILGPLAEQNFRQAMTISAGDWSVFFTRPLSATILALAALALFGPRALPVRHASQGRGVAVGRGTLLSVQPSEWQPRSRLDAQPHLASLIGDFCNKIAHFADLSRTFPRG